MGEMIEEKSLYQYKKDLCSIILKVKVFNRGVLSDKLIL